MRTLSLSLALVLFPALVACGGTESPTSEATGSQSSAVQGGNVDTSAAHNFAVGIANRYGGVCSGTLIAPNLVLTARHCVVPPSGNEAVTCKDMFPANVAPSALGVTTSPNLYRAKGYYQAKEIITPKDTAFCGNDIALVILEDSIPASEATPVTPVVQFSMTDTSKIGGKVVAVGYGITNPSANDSGQRRMREDIDILCIPGDKAKECSGKYASYVDSEKEFVTEGWVCSGDSGSGAFEQSSFEKGAAYVLGTLSRGPQTESECLAAIYTRTDAHAEMIIAAGEKAAAQGGYEEPTWLKPASTDPIPEPGTTTCDGDTCTDVSETSPAEAPTVTKTTTTGCSTSGVGSTGLSGFGAIAIGLAALLAGRRRR